jgi:hypothetical protein
MADYKQQDKFSGWILALVGVLGALGIAGALGTAFDFGSRISTLESTDTVREMQQRGNTAQWDKLRGQDGRLRKIEIEQGYQRGLKKGQSQCSTRKASGN